MKYSIVIPAKNEAESIASTVAGLVDALEGAAIDYEVIVVDDASTDATRTVVDAIGASNPRVRCHPSHNPPRLRLRRPRRASTSSPAMPSRS